MRDSSSDLKVVKQLFDACLDQPRDTHAQLLASSGANDTEVKEVLRLLDIHEQGIEQDQHADIIGRQLQDLSQALTHGQKLGPYEIHREIGRGGMGVVFLAHRADGAFEQRVAIKIAPSFASAKELQHFHQERQILARLQHPNIAMLLDGGATEDSRPYLVMEYVDGSPISEYCREKNLGIEARLKLVLAVCDAVSYAHSHLVIHRDIKPDNVLVTGQGQVKLLDFGISKVLQSNPQATNATQLKGLTLAYASPEQVRGEATTTATDVYGLGTLLYHLLCGCSPHPGGDTSAEKLIEAICLSEPTLPSKAAMEQVIANQRNLLRGDLDNIVGKALRKEPENRYSSVGELQADIARYLRREPVQATPPSFVYRSGKLLSRYPVAAALSLSVFIAVSGGFAAAMYLADKLRSERDNLLKAQVEIENQAHTAKRVTQLLMDMFSAASPANARGRTIDVEELLDTAVENTRNSLDEDPTVKAQLLKTLAQVKFTTGKHKDAVSLQKQALEIERSHTGTSQLQIAGSLSKLGDYYREAGDQDAAQYALAEAITILQVDTDPELLATTRMREGLVMLQLGRPQEAIAHFNAAEQYWSAQPDHGGEEGISTRHNLAIAYYDIADFSSATGLQEQVLQEKLAFYGDEHPKTLGSYHNLGQCYMRVNRWDDARAQLEHAYRISTQIFTTDNITLRTTARQYANLLRRLGYYQRAIDVLSALVTVDAQSEESTAHILATRGYVYFKQGLYSASRRDLDTANAIFSRILPDSSSISFLARGNLGEVMTLTGDRDEGIALIHKIRNLNAQQYGEDDYGVAGNDFRLASIALNEGRFNDAQALLDNARLINTKHFERNHPIQLDVDALEARLAAAQQDWARAENLYRDLLERMQSVFPASAPLVGMTLSAREEARLNNEKNSRVAL
ncbi:serine/threonine-protein kinase [Microbulbifer mangrovi]|uniref:serine/threonine-protein kinase n=1 Tax=Microbulbifer mangrovi TaxID=927787 RepID=UPI0009903E10|nr:serine/threonine-protein kinase [Microbulbifer mangrovi]